MSIGVASNTCQGAEIELQTTVYGTPSQQFNLEGGKLISVMCPDFEISSPDNCEGPIQFLEKSRGVYENVRKVKVQLEDNDYLHFAEVQVFDYTDNNVALNKPATQSRPTSHSAAKAVDGNVNTYSMTNPDQGKHTYDETTLYILFNWNMYPDFAVPCVKP